MVEIEQDTPTVGILTSQKFTEVFRLRYRGLAKKLGEDGVLAAFAYTHDSYNPEKHGFDDLKDIEGEAAQSEVTLVRNLTMKYGDQPLYSDPEAPRQVHDIEFNRLLSRKDKIAELFLEVHPLTVVADSSEVSEAAAAIPGYRVVIKPVSGHRSKGVRVVRKKDLTVPNEPGEYLVQEFIDTSRGDSTLGIEGTHNLRMLSIDSNVIGAITKLGGRRKSMILEGDYGQAYTPEDLPDEVHFLASHVHGKFRQMPGEGQNVIAIDVMYGRSKVRDNSYVICEINARPYRLTPNDLGDPTTLDPLGLLWLGGEWDKTEAKMLARIANEEKTGN